MAEYTSVQALEPLRHVVKDVRKWDLGLECTIDSFYYQVEKRALSRGWKQILLLDLPALGSLYDKGLSRGYLDLEKFPASFGKLDSGRFQDSWIFRSLLQHTFDGFGTLDATTPVEVVAATRQLLYLYKKARIQCPKEGISDAVKDYIAIEEDLRPPHGTWGNDTWIPRSFSFFGSGGDLTSTGLRRDYWRLCDLVFRCLVPRVQLLPEGVVPRHGPGAVSDVCTGSDKFAFPYWPAKLGRLFPSSQFAYANEYLAYTNDIGIGPTQQGDPRNGLSEKEPPCRLLAVPKTFKGPRLIASEPTAHQFIQQGLMQWIRQHMPKALSTCVNFLDQQPSRDAALEASRTGELATVDLSSASDRLSCWVVERAFSSNQTILAALHACRTRIVIDATGTHEGLSLQLKKFAAQGSAVTFPVQTIVYAGMAICSYLWDQGFRPQVLLTQEFSLTQDCVERAAERIRVFGDDIVLPSSSVQTLTAALQALQLKVNVSKTHYLGRFRESCGMDAYCGHDVTPVYVSDLLLAPGAEGLASWIDISNLAHLSALWHLSSWMLSVVDTKTMSGIVFSQVKQDKAGMLILPDENLSPAGETGIRATTFCRGTRFHGSVRMHRHNVYGPIRPNEGLQVQERRVLCVTTKVTKVARGTFQDLYQYLVERPSPETDWSAGYISGKVTLTIRQRWSPVT